MEEKEMRYESFCNTLIAQGYSKGVGIGGDVFTKGDTDITINESNFNSNGTVTITNHQFIPSDNVADYQNVSLNGLTTTIGFRSTDENGNTVNDIYTTKEIPLNELFNSDENSINEEKLKFGYEDVMPVVNGVPLEGTTDDGTEAAEAAQSPETPEQKADDVEEQPENPSKDQEAGENEQSPETQAAEAAEVPVEETQDPKESENYSTFNDLKEALVEKDCSLTGLDIPEDAEGYQIKNGKLYIIKDGKIIDDGITLNHKFNGSAYTVGITEKNLDALELEKSLNELWKEGETPKIKSGVTIDVNDIIDLRQRASSLLEYFRNDVTTTYNKVVIELPTLNNLTKQKLSENGYNVDYLVDDIFKPYQKVFINYVVEIITTLKDAIKDNLATNDNGKGAETGKISRIKAEATGGNSGSSTPSTDQSTVDETVVIDQETLTRLMPAVTGMVTFAEIVSMYEKIGNNIPVQSSEAGQYGLIGVVQENGKYYYKLLDTKTGKVYFTEITEKSKIKWDEKGERKVVEVKDENAMILNKTGESDDGLVRFADKGDVYLLTDDKTTVDGIDYYNIMDSKTDSNAYMVSSDSVSQPKSISDLISAVGDSEVIK